MESTLKNMVITLLTITLISSATVGIVYVITTEPIANVAMAKTMSALTRVLPEGKITNNPSSDKKIVSVDGIDVVVYPAEGGDGVLGYAVESITKSGYAGEFKLMVGFDAELEIVNIEVLQHSETPGLGSKMTEPNNVLLLSFQGKKPGDMKLSVKKEGGDVDAITASTITSKAYIDAVKRAYNAVEKFKKEEGR